VPEGDVTLRINDAAGNLIRTLKGPKKAGINRIHWDLGYEMLRTARLRTPPIEEHAVPAGPEGWRPMIQYGGGPVSVMVPPGDYRITLTVGDKGYDRVLKVLKDPSSAGTEEDIRAQTDLMLRIRRNQDDLLGMVNAFEWVRKQIYDLKGALKEAGGPEESLARLADFDTKIIETESRLFQMRVTSGADILRWPSGLCTKLASLAWEVGQADFRPTEQQVELHRILESELEAHLRRRDELLKGELPALNDWLLSRGVTPVLSVEKETSK
jgi:hypothetical protein